jgi:hypothetical protein
VCASARASSRGAPGRARGPEEGTVTREQLLATGGVRGGSGGGGATWRGEDRASAGWGTAARALERHVAQRRARAGQQVRGTWPAKAAGFTGTSRAEEGRLEVEDRGYSVILQKYKGSTVKLS